MCKTEKKKLCVCVFFGTEHFKKRVIVVYSFQEKNNYTSWELNFKKGVLPIKIISVEFIPFPTTFLGIYLVSNILGDAPEEGKKFKEGTALTIRSFL